MSSVTDDAEAEMNVSSDTDRESSGESQSSSSVESVTRRTDAVERSSDEQIPAETREVVLDRDGHRCQLCGAAGVEAGGTAVLHVHHKEYNPEVCDVHDAENLISLCRRCHNWTHKRPSTSEVPVELSEDVDAVLLEHDYEILQVAASHGPLSTSELVDELTAELSSLAVRERLWLLMGLDNVCESQETRVLDQDVKTGDWGLPAQITRSERGRIPEDSQTLIQRVEDERVRRALDRGCSRKEVADVLDIHPRTTRYKERRARAYAFPLDAFTNHGRPAVESTDAGTESDGEPDDDVAGEVDADVESSSDAGADQQQRLQTVVSTRSGESASHCDEEAKSTPQARSDKPPAGGDSDDSGLGSVGRLRSACSVNEQALVEVLDDGEVEAVSDVEQIDVNEIPPQIRSMVETLAAKLDSQNSPEGGESRLVDS